MTPKNKAEQLVVKFLKHSRAEKDITPIQSAKECALITVNEILELRKGYFDCTNPMQDESFWKEVKQEIEKL